MAGRAGFEPAETLLPHRDSSHIRICPITQNDKSIIMRHIRQPNKLHVTFSTKLPYE